MPMTHADFMRACHLTEQLLRKANPDLRAERCPGKEYAPNHLAWMLEEAEVFHRTAKISKAHRWLGFAQGVMAASHYATVEQLKLVNMPEGETFDPPEGVMADIPTLRDRWFNVPVCVDCWDRCNPERKAPPDHRAEMLRALEEQTKGWDKDDVAANRCPVCDTNVHNGIYVRVTVTKLREMRRTACGLGTEQTHG